ncbi:MAG TPA: hypothetical protein VGL11_07505 [Candidatus Binatia bacterium]|jgi:hypothetical protein
MRDKALEAQARKEAGCENGLLHPYKHLNGACVDCAPILERLQAERRAQIAGAAPSARDRGRYVP